MRYENQNDRDRGGSLFRSLGWMVLGGAAVAAVVVGFGTWRTSDRVFSALHNLFNPAQPAPKVDVQSVVIEQVQGVSELTTAVFTMQAVVPTSQDATFNGFVIGTTKLLYVAYGQIRAGVDLHSLTAADVQVTNDTIRIQLPPPQVLDRKIDVSRSSVYDYNRGSLGLGPDVAPALQALAQQEALKKIVEAACTDSLLEKANDRAKLVVTQLLTTTGHANVTVITQPPPTGTCPTVQPNK